MRNNRFLFVIFIISLLPMLPMLINPLHIHTSDGAMHLARMASYYKEIINGQFPVRWASDLNYGYGTPIFNFFHPLPYYITTVFIWLGLSLSLGFKLSLAISFVLSGYFMYKFIKSFTDNDLIAVSVAIIYQFAPFRIVDLLVRGSLGGAFAYTLLPLGLWAGYEYKLKHKFIYLVGVSLTGALISMSHNITGFIFFGLTVIYFCLLPLKNPDKLKIILSYFYGLLLSASFIVPAIMEHKYTLGFFHTKNLFYAHLTPLWKIILPNPFDLSKYRMFEVSPQLGLFHVLFIIIVIYLVIFKNKKLDSGNPLIIGSVIITAITIFIINPVSIWLWENISVIRQFQYPWRLISILTFTTSMLSIPVIKMFKNKPMIITFLLASTVIYTIYYWIPREGFEKIDESFYWNYPLTTNYYGEVDTVWTEGPQKKYPDSRIFLSEGVGTVEIVENKGFSYKYKIEALTPVSVVQNTQYFPGWKVFTGQEVIPIEFQNQNHRGLITFRLNPGKYLVTSSFTQSKIQKISNIISIVSILAIFLAAIYQKTFKRI